ncbi:MAG: glycosyltransferase family 2 protein [Desulfuromonas thiophila]|jgi:glycosyltransferase involved in cell wall biosynthesis|nr:glycosyltransferase family 2 protein [Desulfuromonas thiophila]
MLNSLKTQILRSAYALSPFDLKGDGWFLTEPSDEIKISCVINFYGRLDLLGGILHSLASQEYSPAHLEVILVEDQGGTADGRNFCESFAGQLPIVYQPLDKNFGQMGYSRNFGLSLTRGEYVLFLDDDTVILQPDFLLKIEQAFCSNPQINALMPRGMASFAVWPGGYDFHDPHFLTSRCAAYRRSDLVEMGGFMSSFVGQEDVEGVIRFALLGKKSLALPEQVYYHPPLIISNLKKPAAVGISFSRLRGRYPTFFLWLVALNCSRHLLLLFSFKRHHREMGRFGLGFLIGFLKGWLQPETQTRYG